MHKKDINIKLKENNIKLKELTDNLNHVVSLNKQYEDQIIKYKSIIKKFKLSNKNNLLSRSSTNYSSELNTTTSSKINNYECDKCKVLEDKLLMHDKLDNKLNDILSKNDFLYKENLKLKEENLTIKYELKLYKNDPFIIHKDKIIDLLKSNRNYFYNVKNEYNNNFDNICGLIN